MDVSYQEYLLFTLEKVDFSVPIIRTYCRARCRLLLYIGRYYLQYMHVIEVTHN
jgi:hypothetical protein